METERKPGWISRGQAAGHAGVSVRTVDRMLANGTLTRHRDRLTRRIWIDVDELNRALSPSPERIRT